MEVKDKLVTVEDLKSYHDAASSGGIAQPVCALGITREIVSPPAGQITPDQGSRVYTVSGSSVTPNSGPYTAKIKSAIYQGNGAPESTKVIESTQSDIYADVNGVINVVDSESQEDPDRSQVEVTLIRTVEEDTAEGHVTYDVVVGHGIYVNPSIAFDALAEAASMASDAKSQLKYDYQVMLGTYPGRNLARLFADEIASHESEAAWFNSRVTSGNFNGIRPHDYFDITLSDGKVFRYRVGAIDPYLHACDQEITKHHVIMVPDQVWPEEIHWNNTNNNNGNATVKNPYLASNLHNWEINTFYPLMPQEWKNVMAEHRVLLEERYSDSGQLTSSNGWSWQTVGKVFSLSEMEVSGSPVWSSMNNGYAVGFDCHFPIFKTTGNRIRRYPNGSRDSWGLRSVHGNSSTNVCYVNAYGHTSSHVATDEWVRPLPCFRVGV